MKQFIKVTLFMIAALFSFTACYENDVIIPTGDYSPIRGGFPQGKSKYDTIIYEIKKDYDVYLLYKEITIEDMNRDWISAGTGDLYVGGDSSERAVEEWSLPEEQLPFYVDFFKNDILANITKEFAKSTFPIKIYMIDKLRTEPRVKKESSEEDNEEEEGSSEATGTDDSDPNKIIKLGDFDNWAISFPDSIVNGTKSDYALKQLRSVFMINVINNSIDKGELVSPNEFWKDYDMRDSTVVNVLDVNNAENGLYTLGYVDVLEEKFGTGRLKQIIKPLPVKPETKPLQHASNWSKGKPGWDLFKAYLMNAMWFTPEEFHVRYNTSTNTRIKEKYDFVVNYIWDKYGIDLVGISGAKKATEEQSE